MEDSRSESLAKIMDLPDDCLCFIFRYLHYRSDRDAFGLTCRRWLQIQNQNRRSLQFDCALTNFKVPLYEIPHRIDTHELSRVLNRFKHLQSLSLSGCTELNDSGLKLLQHYGSSLRALCLDCCFKITDSGLSFAASGCPALKYVSLYRCNVTDMGLETLAMLCSTLEEIDLSYCLNITDHGINSIVNNCFHLRAIRINNCNCISGVGFEGCSQNLAFLEAESCKLDPKGISSMVSGGGLEYLNISNLSWSIHGDGSAAIGSGLGLRLRFLNMRLCRTARDESISVIAKGCTSLVEWNLALCHEIRLAGWESIGLNCHNLEILHVNRCRNLCDLGLQALRNGCRRLSVLYFSGCSRTSPIALDLFRLSRSNVDIKEEENFSCGPAWPSLQV